MILSQVINFKLVILNFLIGYSGYNYIYWSTYFVSPDKLPTNRRIWMSDNKWLSLSTFAVATLTTLLLIIKSGKYELILFAIISFLYILPVRKPVGLRCIPTIKIFLIAVSWAILSSYATFENSIVSFYISFAAMFFFVFSITIPFDIRDLKIDSKKLKTIPQRIGIRKSVWLSLILVLVSMILIMTITTETNLMITHCVFCLVAIGLLHQLHKTQSQLYINFTIEGLPILWLSIIGISSLF